jgi:hypothetical protein
MAPGPPRKRGCVSSPCSPRGASPIRGAPGPTPHRGLGGPGQRPSPRRGMDKSLLPLILYCHRYKGCGLQSAIAGFEEEAVCGLLQGRQWAGLPGHLAPPPHVSPPCLSSGSGSLVGIDNKIEQAMVREDILVPSGPSVHLHSPLLGNTKLHSSTCSLSPWPPSLSLSPAPVPYPCILPPCPFLLWMQRNLSQLPQGTGQRMWVGLGWPGNPDTLPVPGSLGLGEVPPHVCGPGGGRGAKGADPGPGGAERCIRAGEWTAACTGQPRAAGPAAFLGAPSAWAPCT